MSLYDKASLVLIPSGTKAGKVFSQKPVPSNDLLSDELLTNGDFEQGSIGWSLQTGTAVFSNGNVEFQGSTIIRDDIDMSSKTVFVTYTVESADTNARLQLYDGNWFDVEDSVGTHTVSFVASSDIFYLRNSASGNITLSSVSVKKVVDGDFDFTRSSYATRVNSQGLIEKERSNLLLQSNSFDTTWDNTSTDESGGQSGYDGSSDAWLLTKTVSGFSYLYQSVSSSNVQTFSVYAKANTFDYIRLLVIGSSNNPYAYYDLSNGTLGSVHSSAINAKIESIGNGWYRCSLVYNETISQARIYPIIDDGDFTGTGSIFIQDAQLEQGLVATDVIETTTSAVYEGITDNVPRLDYDGDCPSLLLEPQRQNLVTQSEYIGATEWVNASPTRNITITETSNTNPEGRAICWKIQGLNTNNQLAYVDSTTIGTTLTNSIYVKRISGTGDVRLRDVNNFHADFSLSVADGWKRIDVTATATSTVARFYLNLTTHNDEILVWGAQQEEGSFATSYIPTYGTSVTRTGDVCDNAGDSTIFNGSEGVLYGEINPIAIKDQSGYFGLLGTTSANRIIIGFPANSNDVTFFVISQGTTIANSSYDIGNMNQYIKVALKYKENDFSLYINGSKVLTDDNGTPNVEISHLGFFGYTTNQPFYGKCKAIAYFNRALTDTELADLTT